MSSIDTRTVIGAPTALAFAQWHRFEAFPRFMEGVDQVERLSPSRVRFVGSLLGISREWEAHIIVDEPGRRISWESVSGAENSGSISFEPDGPERTRVRLVMDYQPETFAERTGDALGLVKAQVEADLHRFKEYMEGLVRDGGAQGDLAAASAR